jgi:cellulose synthase/poly-beta-1,6-N-acetylglucosamine synthase-like glycosyltransferase
MTPTVTAVVPAFNAERTIGTCLQAISALWPAVAEVIVYVDGASDRTKEIAAACNARVICNEGAPLGPAHARSVAAAHARSDLLLFVDADVVVAAESLRQLVAALADGEVVAAFGSYDDRQASRGSISQYANLRHHFFHQYSAREATTFWTGIGLIDRRVFMALGGFDAAAFAYPSIEDIELGVRLVAAGYRITLVPEAVGTHCKEWNLWRLWYVDIVRRAYPWSCLIADGRTAGADLNVATGERITALFALAVLGFLLLGIAMPTLLLGAVTAATVYIVRNRSFFGFLAARVSLPGLFVSVLMHWSYHCYGSLTFTLTIAMTKLGLRRPRMRSGQAGFAHLCPDFLGRLAERASSRWRPPAIPR